MSAQRPTLDEGRRILRHGTVGSSRTGATQSQAPPAVANSLRKVARRVGPLAVLLPLAWLARDLIRGTLRTAVATLALFGLGVGLVLLLVGGVAVATWFWRKGRRVVGTMLGLGFILVWLPTAVLLGATSYSSYVFDDQIHQGLLETPPSTRVLLNVHGREIDCVMAPDAWAAGPLEIRESYLDEAIEAIEDPEFETRVTGPIDLLGKGRGVHAYAGEGRETAGSTIDEQLGKFIRGRRATDPVDYLEQVLISARVGWLLGDRDQVLARYVNLWEVRPRRRGIPALAIDLFGTTDLRHLSVGQCAVLAGMLRAPSDYDPRRHPDAAKARRDVVLKAMVKTGRLGSALAAAAIQEPIQLADQSDTLGLRAVVSAAVALDGGEQ